MLKVGHEPNTLCLQHNITIEFLLLLEYYVVFNDTYNRILYIRKWTISEFGEPDLTWLVVTRY